MIIDHIGSFEKYFAVHQNFQAAILLFQSLMEKNAEDGTHYAEDNQTDYFVKLMTNTYEDRQQVKPEAHEEYIDIQIIISGAEKIYIPALDQPVQDIPYNDKKDIKFYSPVDIKTCQQLLLTKDTFAVFFPGELHAPGNSAGQDPVRKAVIKVKL